MTRCRIHIEAPPQRVFEVLSRGERYADWVVGARAIRDVDDGFPAPGTSLHHSFGVAPLVVRDQTRVVRVEPPRLLQLEAHAGKLAATVRFELVPDATGTTVVMDEEGADGPSRVVAGMTRVLIAGRNAETLWRLREQVLVDEDTDRPMPSEARSPVEVPRWLGDLTARAFGLAAAVRFPRPLHPSGVTRAGEARLTGRGRLLAGGPTCRVVARFSRGAGLPEPLPDVLGLAVRFVDAFGPGRHHDVLLSSGGPGRLAWVLAPAREGATRSSMGRTGPCCGSAAAESFCASLKAEIGTRRGPRGSLRLPRLLRSQQSTFDSQCRPIRGPMRDGQGSLVP